MTARFRGLDGPAGRPLRPVAKSEEADDEPAFIFPATPPPVGRRRPVAKAFAREADARGLKLEIVRNGSHGMFWLEPLVEFATPQGRIGYGPVQPRTSPRCSTRRGAGGAHPLRLGAVGELDWMKRSSG